MDIAEQFAALPITTTLIAERAQHMPLYMAIIKTPGALLGGTLCAKYRRNEPPFSTLEDFALELYLGKDALDRVRKLADQLQQLLITAPTTDPHFIVMKTDIAYMQYSLHLDNARCLATIYQLSDRSMDAVLHGAKPHQTPDGIRLLPNKAQLVDIYRELYMPRPDIWKQLQPRLADLISVSGGREDTGEAAAEDRKAIIAKLVRGNPAIILLGDYAMRLKRNQPYRNRIIQLLALHPEQFAKDAANAISGETFTQTEPIMRDSRLTRTTVRCHGADIVHIYHNCTYDVIGYRPLPDGGKTTQIGGNYAIARFILVDFWILIGKLQAGRVPKPYFEDKRRELMADLQDVSRGDDSNIPPDHYLGVFVSDAQHAKNVRREQNFAPYYPKGGGAPL